MLKAIAVPVNERLPTECYTVPLIYIYENGNDGVASGYYHEDTKSWVIEHSDDRPGSENITHWIDVVFAPNLRAERQKLRRDILGT